MERSYITIKTTEINTIDFNEVVDTPPRYSLDDTEFVIKWEKNASYIPESILAVPESMKSEVMNHSQCHILMLTIEWTDPNAVP